MRTLVRKSTPPHTAHTLLVINYVMCERDPIFGHQIGVVRDLSNFFQEVIVITSKLGQGNVPPNVRILETNWGSQSLFLSVFRFLRLAIKVLRTNPNLVIFSHMTEVQSALIAPITQFLKIKHFLWYAHTSKSLYLIWCHKFLNGILTSTKGSCPISSKKVIVVGQAIEEAFQGSPRIPKRSNSNFLHVGRLDPSKNISALIETIKYFRFLGSNFSLTLIGAPSVGNEKYIAEVEATHSDAFQDGWLTLAGTVARTELPETLRSFDYFIHAFIGSLDKSILEATYAGIPVLSINPEYLAIFGSWGSSSPLTLQSEIDAILSLTDETIEKILLERVQIINTRHSRKNWLNQVSNVLQGR
jgi:glycosyltransferase involved in cell wall biosynthesis